MNQALLDEWADYIHEYVSLDCSACVEGHDCPDCRRHVNELFAMWVAQQISIQFAEPFMKVARPN